jgi:hypothetical protein
MKPKEIGLMEKFLSLAAFIGLIAIASSAAEARGGPHGNGGFGTSAFAPGQQFRQGGAISGYPGASGYAPGRLYKQNGSVEGYHGASGYAPGHKRKHH